MSGIIGAINTALSGIEAFESGINTVSNNLANETVSGYATESVNLTTQVGGSSSAGDGVQAPVVTRAADGFAAGVLRNANTANQAASTLSANLANISSAVLNNGDIQSTMNQFFEDVSTLAANPSSAGARETVLSDAQTVASSFQSAASSLDTTMTDAGTALQENVTTANNLLGQLAAINKGLQTDPNDPALIDQQEAALSNLSSLLPVNVLTQSNGSVMLSVGGNVLLNQAGADTLTMSGGTATTPPTISVANQPGSLDLSESEGETGANIATWQAGSQALQGLNAIAAVFTTEVNTTQAEGLTYNGAQGANLFSAAPAPTVTAASTNTGSATLTGATITNLAALPTNGGPFQLTYSSSGGGTWTATNLATNTTTQVTPQTSGPSTTLAFAGMTVTVNNSPPASGNTYTINPAPGAASAMTVSATSPDEIAAADPYVGTPGTPKADGSIDDTNSGTITTGTDSVTTTAPTSTNPSDTTLPTSVPAGDYGDTLVVTFTSSTGSTTPDGYSIALASAPGTPVAGGALTSSNGTLSGTISVAYPNITPTTYWQLPISGAPATNDSLTLTPGGVSSGSNATRMAALWTGPNTSSDGTLQQAAIGLVTTLGANASEAQTLATGTSAQVASATSNLQNIAGVNTDAQAVLLVNYQQAYQAAAQVISTADTMFQSLLTAVAT